jgi:hypothetical protein
MVQAPLDSCDRAEACRCSSPEVVVTLGLQLKARPAEGGICVPAALAILRGPQGAHE